MQAGAGATEQATQETGPVGLGGWLILVGIGIVISPVAIGALTYETYLPILQDGTWDYLTTPGTDAYHPWWKPLLLAEVAINIATILGYLILIFLFFMKKRLFPALFIFLVAVNIGSSLLSAAAVQVILPDQPFFDEETRGDFLRSLVSAAIWVPYMMVSRRVKATFVR